MKLVSAVVKPDGSFVAFKSNPTDLFKTAGDADKAMKKLTGDEAKGLRVETFRLSLTQVI